MGKPTQGITLVETVVACALVSVIVILIYGVLNKQEVFLRRIDSDIDRNAAFQRIFRTFHRDFKTSGSNPIWKPPSVKADDSEFTVSGVAYPYGVNPNPGETHDLISLYSLNLVDRNGDGYLDYDPDYEGQDAWGNHDSDIITYRFEDLHSDGNINDFVRVDVGLNEKKFLALDVEYVELEFKALTDTPPLSSDTNSDYARVRVTPSGRTIDDTVDDVNRVASVKMTLGFLEPDSDRIKILSRRFRKWIKQ